MSLSIWQVPSNVGDDRPVIPAGENIYGEYLGAYDVRTIEDEDTGHLFVALDERTTLAAAKLVEMARGTAFEDAVRDLMGCLSPGINGPTADAWCAAVGYTERERREQAGIA